MTDYYHVDSKCGSVRDWCEVRRDFGSSGFEGIFKQCRQGCAVEVLICVFNVNTCTAAVHYFR